MKTIGRRRPATSPRGDVEGMCDVCGVHWLMSELRRGEDGLLHCPDEGNGMDKVECARDEAESKLGHVDKRGGYEPSNTTTEVEI